MTDDSMFWMLGAALVTFAGFALSMYVAHLEHRYAQPHCPRFDIFRGQGVGLLLVSVLCLCLYLDPYLVSGHDRPFAFWSAFTIGYLFTLLSQRLHYLSPEHHPTGRRRGEHCGPNCPQGCEDHAQ